MRGVCCTCQEVHTVKSLPVPDIDGEDWMYDDEDTYVLVEHSFQPTAIICAGSGTTPQKLVSVLLDIRGV